MGWSLRHEKFSTVYVVRGLFDGPQFLYKIGASTQLEKRLKALSKKYGLVSLVAIIERGGYRTEKKLHKMFAAKRKPVKGCYEWFALTPEDLDKIKKIKGCHYFPDPYRKSRRLLFQQVG